jgi:hypothetical protein
MYWLVSSIVVGLRTKDKPPNIQSPGQQLHSQNESAPIEEKDWILCRQCNHRLCRPDDGIAVNGSHRHTFANPSGIVFEIACFRNVGGCSPSGFPSSEFTWFSGHTWQIVICSSCRTHLGWQFVSSNNTRFFGLIGDRIEKGTSHL